METQTRTKMWKTIGAWGAVAFAAGLIGGMIAEASGAHWMVSDPLMLMTLAGLIASFLGLSKTSGGLRVGLIAAALGTLMAFIGYAVRSSAGSSLVMGVEFTRFSDPAYIVGAPIYSYGMLILIAGGVTAIASYLIRLLRAVESRPTN